MTTDKYLTKIVEVCLDIGEKRMSKIQEHQRLLTMYGLVGLRTKHFLNSLLSNGKSVFLELGVYRGASLTCALYKNPEVKAYGVDNWHYSPIDHPAEKKDENGKYIPFANVRWTALDNLAKYSPNGATIIEKDWLELKKSDVPDPVDIVHIHTKPNITKEEFISYLNVIYPLTQSSFILVVDLHMIEDIRQAIVDWSIAKKVKINSSHHKASDSLSNGDHWWGGLGVYVLTKEDITK